MTALLAIKVHQPAPPPKHVRRRHLVQRLNDGLASGRQVTLVSAPAGFGKTTFISEWTSRLDQWLIAWLSLDSSDDDPRRFTSYLVAALQRADGSLGQEVEAVLRSGQLPPSDVISTILSNDVQKAERRLVLVLDDFQVIQDAFSLQVMEMLINNLPRLMHLVVITREDPSLPLGRLRAHNRLTEIRARDLRFSPEEAERFFDDVMGLSLSQMEIVALDQKTEGWIAGLQLAALSVQDRTDRSRFIAHLSGSHRFIVSYLTEQVLDRQSDEIQQFLLQTSILDKLNGDLCNAVTGRTDGRALLEQLYNANLFLVPLDEEGNWYRYHHLFADLLRSLQDALENEQTADLHRRASRWYARHSSGAGGTFVGEAIQHALAAEDYGLAVKLLESHASEMIMQGYAKTVNGWVQAIPARWLSHSPRTDLALAWMHLLRGAYAEASPYLQRSRVALDSAAAALNVGEERTSLMAEWLAMRSLLLYMQREVEESQRTATEAVAIVSKSDDRVRSLAHYALASACQLAGEHQNAVEAYQMAIRHARAADNLVAEMLSTAGLALLAFENGQLGLAHEIAEPVGGRLERSMSLPPICGVIFGLLGEVYCQWYQIEQARHHTLRALQLSTLGGYKSGSVFCHVLLSRLALIEGDLETAAGEIRKAAQLMSLEIPDDLRHEFVAQQVRTHVARNRLGAAVMVLEGQGFAFGESFTYPDLPPGRIISHSCGLMYNSSLLVLVHQASAGQDPSRSIAGIGLASRLIDRALRGPSLIVALEALQLRAQLYGSAAVCPTGAPTDADAGHADYVRALQLGEPEGFVGVFVEQGPRVAEDLAHLAEQGELGTVQPNYVEEILTASSAAWVRSTASQESPSPPSRIGPRSLAEPLTDREVDVLRLMSQGLKYKEIAEELFISLNTVRYHVKGIYGKLDVSNRTQAIETARQFRLL